jgi:hypothetical protein|nr:MAG TPA: FaeA-like protein [Caudoviricetes sp.]
MESKLIQKKPGNRELIWSAIRQLKTFRVRDLEDKTRVHERTILSYLQVLTKAGILEKKKISIVGHGSLTRAEYTLIKDKGVNAPKFNRKGINIEDTIQSKVWRAIRVTKKFSLKDLVATVSDEKTTPSASAIERYLISLKAAGYLSKKKNDKIYHLINNTGPKAPQIQKTKKIYDPNLQSIVWESHSDEEEA